MFPVLVVGLAFSGLLVFVAVGIALYDAAFATPARDAATKVSRREWRPPLIHGDELSAWASRATAARIRHFFARRDTNVSGPEIFSGVCEGLRQALEHGERSEDGRLDGNCANCCHQLIAITPPEALAIAESLHCHCPEEIPQVSRRARDNARRVSAVTPERYEAENIVCPLLGERNACLANEARPIHCRGWRANAGNTERSSAIETYARSLSRGMAEGLSAELKFQGLDGNRYELNSALAVALETSNLDEAWSHGKAAFGGCQRA